MAIILMIVSSSLMYYVENEAQPGVFSSIPATMWWGAITLTTVGYGDIYPITVPGKILGILIAMTGVGIVALPAGILASGFVTDIGKKNNKKICPHCGKTTGE
jgi:voltage-gated potassium channel